MKIDVLKHTIINTTKSITYWMKKPDVRFFKTILGNMLEYRTTVLSQLWNTDEKSAKELKNYYSKHLWKNIWIDLWEKIEKRMIKFIWKINKEENCFCFDTVDTNKNSAKKMEWLKIVRDWSNWTLWNWFTWHWVSIKWIPLFLKREPIISKDEQKELEHKSLKYSIFKKQVVKIQSNFWKWCWILADRWYDDFKKFSLLDEHSLFFCIRLKTNRNVLIVKWERKWEIMKSWDLKTWKYTVMIKWIEKPLFIFVKALHWLKNPIRVISNVDDDKNIERYLKRWEIERIFKTWKQEFNFEKIWTQSVQKTENLVYLVQLCLGISAYIFNKLNPKFEFEQEKNETISFIKMCKKIRPFLQKKGLSLNRNSITSFIAYYMKFIRKTKSYFSKPTPKPSFSLQISWC